MKTLKYSRQREAIVDSLKNRTDHPTAEMVYNDIKKIYPNISLGTVYRNLALLSENGIIIRINCGDDAERFDGNTQPHYHFICRECGNVLDLEMDSLDFINTLASTSFNGKILGNFTYFYGFCENCVDKAN